MDFTELAEQRYSLRKFSPRKVEQKKLDLILQAGRAAPTACNNQPQRILVLQSAESLEKVKKCTPYSFGAPLTLLVCYDSAESWKRKYDGRDSGNVDAAIVGTHMMMEAAELGLGSTWVGSFDPAAVVREFSLPSNLVPVALFPMGYPAEDAGPSVRHADRRPLEQTVRYERF